MNHNTPFLTPIDRLKHWQSEQPNAPYLHQPIGQKMHIYTWQRVADEVSRMAKHLSKLPANSQVAIISLNCAHWMMADWAIQMAGHVSVPIYPTASQKSMRYILKHAEVAAVFVGKLFDQAHVLEVLDSETKVMSIYQPIDGLPFWDVVVAKESQMGSPANPAATDLMSIVYTSGTTGDPKGVMVSYGAVSTSMYLIKDRIEVGPSDRFVSYLPLAHVAERMAVEMSSLYKGSQVYFVRSLDSFAQDVKRANPTIFFGVPRIWHKMRAAIEDKLGGHERCEQLMAMPVIGWLLKKMIVRGLGFQHMRFALCAAASVPKSLLAWYHDLGFKLNEAYGMTESCGLSHMTKNEDQILGSVGKPLSRCECQISDQGEVWIRNPSVMMGYYKKPELTAETVDEAGWLHTGDLGYIDDDGYLYITGRIKDIFKTSKGKYVAPLPIEHHVQRALGLDHVVLMGDGLGQPVMVVSTHEAPLASDFSKRCEDMLVFLQSNLESHEKPSHLFITNEAWLPENGLLTPTLKMQRPNLEQHFMPKVSPFLSKPGVHHLDETASSVVNQD